MAVLESCPKHNMVAYLEKTDGNTEFHEIISFLTRSSIHYALTVSPVVSTTFVEQFWMSAKSKIINNVRYITAKVAGKPVSISEASIRSDLLFDDADGIDSLPNQAIFDAIQLMGYEGDLTVLTFNKALLFSHHGDSFFHNKEIIVLVQKALLGSNSHFIATAEKFVMDPSFISIFLDKQLVNVPVPLDHFPVNALTSKVFAFMVKKGKHFSGRVTSLFTSMLAQPTKEYDPSPSPSPSTHILIRSESLVGNVMEIKEVLMKESQRLLTPPQSLDEECILEAKLAGKKILKKNWMQKESVSKLGRKSAKAEPSVHKDPLFDELDDDEIDNMETEDAQGIGRTRYVVHEEKERKEKEVSTEDVVSTDKEKVSTDKEKDSTEKEKDSTDKQKDNTDRPDEGTVDQTEGRSASPITPTPTPTIFGDDETIAQVLLNMSQAKVVSREKEKGVELKDVEETERPRPTLTRSLLTLKPLLKIDPKDKGKRKIEAEACVLILNSEEEGAKETSKKEGHSKELPTKVGCDRAGIRKKRKRWSYKGCLLGKEMVHKQMFVSDDEAQKVSLSLLHLKVPWDSEIWRENMPLARLNKVIITDGVLSWLSTEQ
ncbi:hypothetical protein Tco_1458129 [Tanacetum coccineum]